MRETGERKIKKNKEKRKGVFFWGTKFFLFLFDF